MKAVFTTPTIRPRSTAQTITGSQIPRLDRPTRKAGRPTAGRRREGNVAAGVVVDRAEEALAVVGAAEEGAAGVAVAIFREEGKPMAIVRVADPASRMVNPEGPIKGGPIRDPNGKGPPS